ncbi:MAG: helix-turn-helix domain-containing protein, partial [Solirubrobacteraceae bacterium]
MVSASLLVQARRAAGLSQRELAARAGVAQQEIARY